MPDNPVVLNGTQEQIITGAILTHAVLQDLADKHRLQADDFRYISGRQAPSRGGSRMGSTHPPARFAVARGLAGFLIGKGGEKIKRLRDETGATLQFRGPDEEPALALSLSDDERVLDIRGSQEQRDLAVQACWRELDAAPDPPQNTKLLVPTNMERIPIEEAAATACATLTLGKDTRVGSPEPGEVIALLEGAAAARLAASLAILARVDALGGLASPASATPARQAAPASPARQAALPSTQGGIGPASPDRQVRTDAPIREQAASNTHEERRTEPESGKAFTFAEFQKEFTGKYTETEIREYWRDACKPISASERVATVPDEHPSESLRTPQSPAPQQSPHSELRREQEPNQNMPGHEPRTGPERVQPERHEQQQSQQPHDPRQMAPTSQSSGHEHSQPLNHQSQQPLHQEHLRHAHEDTSMQPRSDLNYSLKVETQQSGACGSFMHSAPVDHPGCGQQKQQGFTSPFNSFASGNLTHGFGSSGFGMFGNPGMFSSHGMFRSQLHLLLPHDVIRSALVPWGQMTEIALGCNVQIDLGNEVAPNQLQVVVTGTCLANSMAALALQFRVWFAQKGGQT
eukprot:TRINITY_DN33691_c0_g1_i1.p1 TRINITY_DN33691_c0_g1~~TRINITY_DN33691_c0_g1_i1.p1  ORF type:complete len:675 (-),score=109.27 TRINITY_DN33691_c0_g1_i1:37-1767(-)